MSRELDAAIAEALGYVVAVKRSNIPCVERYYITRNGNKLPLPDYSDDSNAMLELDKEMRASGLYLQISFDHHGCYTQYKLRNEVFMGGSFAETEPLARALAAYKALTEGKEWTESNI